MNQAPDVLLFIHTTCPHCPAILTALVELVKQGSLGRLEIVNISEHPEQAEALNIRTVPWYRIGSFELEGLHSLEELRQWAEYARNGEGIDDYFDYQLQHRGMQKVERFLTENPSHLVVLVKLLASSDTAIQTRLGIGALLEEREGTEKLQALLEPLGQLTRHTDHRVRTDACHYLGLTHSSEAKLWLTSCLQDEYEDVRETAADSLALLEDALKADARSL